MDFLKSLIILPIILVFYLLFHFTDRDSDPNHPLTVHKLFSSGAVLQRDAPIPVWGTAPPRKTVTVSLNQDEQSVRTSSKGKWRVTFPPQTVGGPHKLMITTDHDSLVAENILFGDVWVASGQSNMEWTVTSSANPQDEIASANDTFLRHYKIPRSWSYTPEDTLWGGEWHVATPKHVGAFTAVGYSFARELRASTGIPIGILNTSWGGSRIEAWMDLASLGMDADQINQLSKDHNVRSDSLTRVFTREHGGSPDRDPGYDEDIPIWAHPELDDADWMEIPVPGTWEAGGLDGLNGSAWYRTTFNLDEVPSQAVLRLGTIDDQDRTWINGQLVGETDEYLIQRTYPIREGVLQSGLNQVTIRVQDTGGGGGLVVGDSNLSLEWSSGKVDLMGTWKIRVGEFSIEPDDPLNHQPTLLYNAMIHPILDFPITGFIWYQGEANANDPETAAAYASQFQTMITRWRTLWDHELAPFLFVSLASFRAPQEEPGESNWAILRESQATALSLPNVGQAITLDIGDADDIHPKNKQDVGIRLALWAGYLSYGTHSIPSGPIYRNHVIEDGIIHLQFDYVGGGLMAKGGPLRGFAIAGDDGNYIWAEAQIRGDSVMVFHPEIPNPSSVRYAWADNPSTANLMNAEGLPAAPFRTTP